MPTQLIQVLIRSREGVEFDSQVRAITAVNARGMFDVLPVHTNFVTVLRQKLVLHLTDGAKKEFNIDSAVLRVLTGKVEVYLGIK